MITQEKLDKLFALLRIVHTSHWKAPKAEEVLKEIQRTGAFVFRIGADPWVAEVRITDDSASYEVNPDLPERMRRKAEEMKRRFETALTASS